MCFYACPSFLSFLSVVKMNQSRLPLRCYLRIAYLSASSMLLLFEFILKMTLPASEVLLAKVNSAVRRIMPYVEFRPISFCSVSTPAALLLQHGACHKRRSTLNAGPNTTHMGYIPRISMASTPPSSKTSPTEAQNPPILMMGLLRAVPSHTEIALLLVRMDRPPSMYY